MEPHEILIVAIVVLLLGRFIWECLEGGERDD